MLLIVRSANQIPQTEDFFRAHNCAIISFPISTTTPIPVQIPANANGLIITSPNSLPAIPQTTIPLHCVGQKTADQAEKNNFTIGEVGTTNAASFAHQLAQNLPPQNLVHIAGDTASTDWYKTLELANFQIKKLTAYTTKYTHKFTSEILEALKNQQVKKVLFFSVAGAEQFIQLLHAHGMQEKGLHAITFSAHIESITKNFAKTTCATHPTLQAMLNASN